MNTLAEIVVRGSVSLTVFFRNSNSMEILFHSYLDSNIVIATNFWIWHDSCAVVACAKNCCDLVASSGITPTRNFHRIWIAGEKVSETGPGAFCGLLRNRSENGVHTEMGLLSQPHRWVLVVPFFVGNRATHALIHLIQWKTMIHLTNLHPQTNP